MISRKSFLVIPILLLNLAVDAQSTCFERIDLLTDTAVYSSKTNSITINNIRKIYFYFAANSCETEARIYQKSDVKRIELLPSRDFELVDSMLYTGEYYRVKVRFRDLIQTELLKFSFKAIIDTSTVFEDIYLQPLTNTSASIRPADDQLFIGEEKVYEVFSNNPQNIKISNEWINGNNYDYRFSSANDRIYLHIVPKTLGELNVTAPLMASKPYLNKSGKLEFQPDPIVFTFSVKASQLQFLGLDKQELTFSEDSRLNGLEILLENSRLLDMQKTYRIEAQEEPGGTLIAEIFTRQRMANNKVLCVFRPYNLHRNSDGYLYIKDGDEPRFITNVSITPPTQIEKISILHEGSDWREGKTIFPGETFDLKIQGKGLHKAKFHFEDLIDITSDTLIKSENELVYKLKVPVDITKKKINIYNYNVPSGELLNIAEYQRPREFDFIFLNYGDIGRRVSSVKEPILYENVIKDLIISFNTDKIDDEKLYGKQYIDIRIQITGKNNELIELKTIDNIAVCPSGQSPRSSYYNTKDCFAGDISLNKYIRKPTYTLDEWSRINIVISHKKDKYGGDGYQKEIDIILKRKYSFDVEVSFPAGLLTVYPGDTTKTLGNLSGISMAMIAQFSFYHPEKINTYRPFKVGAGFLALNAFNLSEGMDLGLVVLGSVYPTTKDKKLSFPLYVGCGYSLSKDAAKSPADRFFFLVGPGIRVKF